MRARSLLFLTCLAVSVADAGVRGPREYAGTVVVDRWGGVYLHSSVYLMYISEGVKSALQERPRQQVLVDVLDVWQPIDPGDGLIRRYVLLSHPPTEDEWVPVRDLRVRATARFGSERHPAFELAIENTGSVPIRFMADELGMTLLTQRTGECRWHPADGPSFALVTRQSFWGFDSLVTHDAGSRCGHDYSWRLEAGGVDAPLVMLEPGVSSVWRVVFDLPPGEYEFLFGYGGGVHDSLGLASNQIAFDVDAKGRAVVVSASGRPGGSPSNRRVNPTVHPVTGLACARPAPPGAQR